MTEEQPYIPGRKRRALATYGSTVVVSILALFTLLSIRAERTRDAWVTLSREVQLGLERTLSDVQDAEVGQRGYLLTGDSAYLQPYNRGISAVKQHVSELLRLTEDNPTQHARVQTMNRLIEHRIQRLHDNVHLVFRGRLDSAQINARLGVGRVLMDSLRTSIAELISTEDTLLFRREADTTRNERSTILIVVIGSLLAAALSLLMNMLITAYSKEQQQAALRLADQNARLTDQANQLTVLNDELAEQAMEVEQQAQHLQEQAAELEMQRDELQDAAAQLQQRTEAAEEANRAKSDFLRAMSHELRTPLNAIGGYTQLIELGIRGPVTAEQQEDLSRITRSQRHLLSLINDVLNYAKLEAGRVNYEMLDISMHEMILAMDELVRPQMQAKKINYKCDAGPEELLVRVDPEKALQIMLNLLSNAVKFTPVNGTIDVKVEHNDGIACVHVRDTGIGIPADKQESVFEPFIQVGRTMSGPTEGTGLGLSISRDLARGMGGDLTLESEPGKGSTFTLCLKTTEKAVHKD